MHPGRCLRPAKRTCLAAADIVARAPLVFQGPWEAGRKRVAVGQYTSDLERGDVLGPVEYTLSPFVVREYCHAVELHQDCFQRAHGAIMPPTLIHLDKLRLYRHACPRGTGPHARVHVEYEAT